MKTKLTLTITLDSDFHDEAAVQAAALEAFRQMAENNTLLSFVGQRESVDDAGEEEEVSLCGVKAISDKAYEALQAIVDHATEVLELDELLADVLGIENFDPNDEHPELAALWNEVYEAVR